MLRWLLLKTLNEEPSGHDNLLLALFEVVAVFGVQNLRISILHSLVVFQKVLLVDHVLEVLLDLFKVDVLVSVYDMLYLLFAFLDILGHNLEFCKS